MYSEIGIKIYELRTINRISAKTLADKVGVTTQQMYKYEKGVNRIPVCRLVAIAQIFNKPIEYFIASLYKKPEVLTNLRLFKEGTLMTEERKSILFSITSPSTRMVIKKQ